MKFKKAILGAIFVSVGAVAACSGDTEGGGGDAGGAGGEGASGGSATGGTGGSAGTAGSGGTSTGGSSGSSSGGTGGSGGDAGNGTSGEAGTGGTGEEPTDPDLVHGRVIDRWRHPVPNVPVQIGDTRVTTDALGEFEIDGVGETYDVSLLAQWNDGFIYEYAYVYQGLERRDPTLQIYVGMPSHSVDVEFTTENLTLGENQTALVALGGPDIHFDTDIEPPGQTNLGVYWRGPASMQANAYGLLLTTDGELPTSYNAFHKVLTAMVEMTEPVQVTLDFAPETIPAFSVLGAITPPGGSNRENRVYLTFDGGGAMPIIEDSGAANYSYVVPNLPGTSITVAAIQGSFWYDPSALAYRSGLTPSANVADLEIPTPVNLISPSPEAEEVDVSTEFEFQAPEDEHTFVVNFQDTGADRGIFLITSSTTVTLPPVLGGDFTLRNGASHTWEVETHGSFQSVDEMAGPSGFIDWLAYDVTAGPTASEGRHSLSGARGFYTAE